MNAKFFKVKSFSDPNKEYTVRQMPDGEWRCECPEFIFRKQRCDHIRKVRHQKMKHHGRE